MPVLTTGVRVGAPVPPGKPLRLPADDQRCGIEIDVLPAEPERFALTQTQRQGDAPPRSVAAVSGQFGDPPGLGQGERLDLGLAHRGGINETLADEVIRKSTDFDGTERAPMRTAEARVTLGVIAAREGDIEQAVHQGERALSGPRQSLPTLAMVSRDLARILKDRYPGEQAARSYLDHVRTVVGASNLSRRRTE